MVETIDMAMAAMTGITAVYIILVPRTILSPNYKGRWFRLIGALLCYITAVVYGCEAVLEEKPLFFLACFCWFGMGVLQIISLHRERHSLKMKALADVF